MTDEKVSLSERLFGIAQMVRLGGTICDVGCDHAHVPIALLKEGRIKGALLMDIIPGPLIKAQENLVRYGCDKGVMLRQSDGLAEYRAGEAQSLLISGMGGRIIRKILLREPDKTCSFSELILQPQADPEEVRKALQELGLEIDDEMMLTERGKYYFVMHAVHGDGVPAKMSEAELRFGPVLLKRKDPVLHKYLLWRKAVQEKILASLENAETDREETQRSREQAKEKLEIIEEGLKSFSK